MNNQSITLSRNLFFLVLTFTLLLTLPRSYADDDNERQYMGMGYGHMGQGHMGYGNMGPGHMGYGHMGSGHMGYGHMGSGHMGSGHMGFGHMGLGRMGMMGMGYGFLNSLDLSDNQRTTIRNIHKEMRPRIFALQDKIAELNDELRSLYKEEKPNEKKVGAVYKKIFDLKRQQIELGISTNNKTYDVLNKKQKDKLKELKSSGTGYRSYKGMPGRGMHQMME